MGAINRSDKIAATLYPLGTWFVSGIYVKIPCIKEIVMMMMVIIIVHFIYYSACRAVTGRHLKLKCVINR
jgi:hypothetical protein